MGAGRTHDLQGTFRRGPQGDSPTAWERLFRDWLPQSGFQPDDGPCMELYGHDAYDPATRIFRCELCVPVRPL